MGEIWNWLTSDALAPTIGFLGLVLGAVGFPITLWQLWRTKKAAHAAVDVANDAKLRLNSFSALREVEFARTKAEGVKSAIVAADWPAVAMLYQDLAHSLIQLAECDAAFGQEVRDAIKNAVTDCENNCDVVEKALSSSPEKLLKGKQLNALRGVEVPIVKAITNLERLAV